MTPSAHTSKFKVIKRRSRGKVGCCCFKGKFSQTSEQGKPNAGAKSLGSPEPSGARSTAVPQGPRSSLGPSHPALRRSRAGTTGRSVLALPSAPSPGAWDSTQGRRLQLLGPGLRQRGCSRGQPAAAAPAQGMAVAHGGAGEAAPAWWLLRAGASKEEMLLCPRLSMERLQPQPRRQPSPFPAWMAQSAVSFRCLFPTYCGQKYTWVRTDFLRPVAQ